MKKFITMLAVAVLSVSLVACGGGETPTPPAEGGEVSGGEAKELTEAFAEYPLILTSVGQSQELQMLKSVLDKQDIEHEIDPVLTADKLGDAKTLALVVGGSSKGLGAAGIDAEDEIARANAVIEEAKAKDMKIIVLHLGKDARRGDLSDKFITPTLDFASYIIVVDGGNDDGIFTNAAIKNDIPLAEIDSIGKVAEPFIAAFK